MALQRARARPPDADLADLLAAAEEMIEEASWGIHFFVKRDRVVSARFSAESDRGPITDNRRTAMMSAAVPPLRQGDIPFLTYAVLYRLRAVPICLKVSVIATENPHVRMDWIDVPVRGGFGG
jgi:hypothetical protein